MTTETCQEKCEVCDNETCHLEQNHEGYHFCEKCYIPPKTAKPIGLSTVAKINVIADDTPRRFGK